MILRWGDEKSLACFEKATVKSVEEQSQLLDRQINFYTYSVHIKLDETWQVVWSKQTR